MSDKTKVAIVTGAGSGMGKSIAFLFAQNGMKVVVAEINEKSGQEVVREIESSGGEAIFLAVDVSSSKDTQQMAIKTLERFNRIDVMVANAGIEDPLTPTHQISEERWDRMVNVHLKGTFLCCKAVLPQMMKQKYGRIITFSSVGVKLRAGNPHYTASKAGIEALTRIMAVEYAPHGILVNCVAPGFIATPMWDMTGGVEGEFAKQIISQIPAGRSAEPVEVANVVAFLVSEEASYINGQVIDINGGLA